MVESVKLDVKKQKRLMDNRQQESLESFYKKYFELDGYYMLYFIGSGFCAAFFTCNMFIPFQETRYDIYLQIIMVVCASYLYSAAYSNCRGNGKEKMIYEKLKYLPISENQFKLSILRKWCKKCMIILATSLIGQLYTTWVAYNEISWINVVYALGMGLILPIAVSVLNLILKEKGYVCLIIIQWIVIISIN